MLNWLPLETILNYLLLMNNCFSPNRSFILIPSFSRSYPVLTLLVGGRDICPLVTGSDLQNNIGEWIWMLMVNSYPISGLAWFCVTVLPFWKIRCSRGCLTKHYCNEVANTFLVLSPFSDFTLSILPVLHIHLSTCLLDSLLYLSTHFISLPILLVYQF